jgi:hypothetical protein
MEQLRLRYRSGDGGVPVNAYLRSHRVFLSAGGEVLSNADTSVVICVEVDYEAADYVPRNSRGGWGRRYCLGCMLIKVAEIVALWKELEDNDLEMLAPQMIEGNSAKIWESVAY